MEYYQTKTLEQVFVERYTTVEEIETDYQFMDIVTVLDFWKYLETTFLEGVHGPPNTTIAEPKKRFVAFENLLMGSPRIRQVRVKKDTDCSVNDMFKRQFRDCYQRYAYSRENTTSEFKGYVCIWRNVSIELNNFHSRTKYQSATENNNFVTFGDITNYGGGGYVQDLYNSREKNLKIIENLHKSEWIDRATRLVCVELALYNGNTDVYSEMKLAIEILPTGGVFPFHNIKVFHIMRMTYARDYALVFVMVLFYLIILIYFVDFILNLAVAETRKTMFCSVWTYLDMLLIMFAICTIVLSTYLPFALNSYINNNEAKDTEYFGMDKLSMAHLIYSNFTALLIFFSWVKSFKFIGFNKTMMQFSTTLSKVRLLFGVLYKTYFNFIHERCLATTSFGN